MADQTARTKPPETVADAKPPPDRRSSSIVSEPARAVRHTSTSSIDSPRRHQHRQHTAPRRVKETLDARSEYTTSQDDGTAQHRINQYIIKQEIGRGSFGAVHVAVDQYGNEYAVKEFSKARLRKRQQSHMIRRPRCPQRPESGFNSPLHRHPTGDDENGHPLDLIREEIAIMKKLNHPNLVSLIEVLDDPTEDSLYMVMEMCKKGVIMKVGLGERADPYDDERCRLWFRDLILGIEYLHAQGIAHRDIKPDNCLLTNDDVLKVVDFGVSEMFAKDSDMYTAKSVGSPAFLPPELCVVGHGDVSGRAADIWSMGVTLYCLRYGRIPFEKQSILELYESIRSDEPDLGDEKDEDFIDLMRRIFEKDPSKRVTMSELRNHPWVTKGGTDPLLSEEENTAEIVEPPTEEEMNSAITKNLGNILAVMKAVQRFKRLVHPNKGMLQSILGQEHESHFVQPPLEMDPDEGLESITRYSQASRNRPERFRSSGAGERGRSPKRTGSGISTRSSRVVQTTPTVPSRENSTQTKRSTSEGTRGHARDPLEEECPYLFIGPSRFTGELTDDDDIPKNAGSRSSHLVLPSLHEPDTSIDGIDEFPDTLPPVDPDAVPVVSESPGACSIDIYETAYREEIERIKARSLARKDTLTKVYLTRRVEDRKQHLNEVMRILQPSSTTTSTTTTAATAASTLGNVDRDDSEQTTSTAQRQQQQQEPIVQVDDQNLSAFSSSSPSSSSSSSATTKIGSAASALTALLNKAKASSSSSSSRTATKTAAT